MVISCHSANSKTWVVLSAAEFAPHFKGRFSSNAANDEKRIEFNPAAHFALAKSTLESFVLPFEFEFEFVLVLVLVLDQFPQ